MAIIDKFKIESGTSNAQLSRYKNLYRITDTEGNTYIETPNKMTIKTSQKDSFYSVEKGYEDRLDLISYKFYHTPLLWWVIAEANNITNPLLVESGEVLRIPNITNLYEDGGVL